MVRRRFKCILRIGLCGSWIELYEIEGTTYPRFGGHFFLAFRKKWERKVLPFMTGLTGGGAKIIIGLLTQPPGSELSEVLTQIILAVGRKMEDPLVPHVSLAG